MFHVSDVSDDKSVDDILSDLNGRKGFDIHQVDSEVNDLPLLHAAIEANKTTLVAALIQYASTKLDDAAFKAWLNTKARAAGETVLMIAYKNGATEITEQIIDVLDTKGLSESHFAATDNEGRTVLHYAVNSTNNARRVRADNVTNVYNRLPDLLYVVDNSGFTPLARALINGSREAEGETASFLIDQYDEAHLQNEKVAAHASRYPGHNLLYLAVEGGAGSNVVQALKNAGVRIDEAGKDNETALQRALRSGDTTIQDILNSASGARRESGDGKAGASLFDPEEEEEDKLDAAKAAAAAAGAPAAAGGAAAAEAARARAEDEERLRSSAKAKKLLEEEEAAIRAAAATTAAAIAAGMKGALAAGASPEDVTRGALAAVAGAAGVDEAAVAALREGARLAADRAGAPAPAPVASSRGYSAAPAAPSEAPVGSAAGSGDTAGDEEAHDDKKREAADESAAHDEARLLGGLEDSKRSWLSRFNAGARRFGAGGSRTVLHALRSTWEFIKEHKWKFIIGAILVTAAIVALAIIVFAPFAAPVGVPVVGFLAAKLTLSAAVTGGLLVASPAGLVVAGVILGAIITGAAAVVNGVRAIFGYKPTSVASFYESGLLADDAPGAETAERPAAHVADHAAISAALAAAARSDAAPAPAKALLADADGEHSTPSSRRSSDAGERAEEWKAAKAEASKKPGLLARLWGEMRGKRGAPAEDAVREVPAPRRSSAAA